MSFWKNSVAPCGYCCQEGVRSMSALSPPCGACPYPKPWRPQKWLGSAKGSMRHAIAMTHQMLHFLLSSCLSSYSTGIFTPTHGIFPFWFFSYFWDGMKSPTRQGLAHWYSLMCSGYKQVGVDIPMAFSRRLCSVLKSLSRHKVELVMSLRHLKTVPHSTGAWVRINPDWRLGTWIEGARERERDTSV